MTFPAFDLQTAVVTTLKAANTLAGARVYDRVPANPTFPFLQIGNDQIIPAETYQFQAAWECSVVVHAFSRSTGKPEVKTLAGSVVTALANNIPVSNFETVTWEVVSTHYLTDPDGLTEHAVIEVKYILNAL